MGQTWSLPALSDHNEGNRGLPTARAPFQKLKRPSWANKFARLCWLIGYYAFFRFSPTPLHAWRRQLLRFYGAKIAQGAVIYPSVQIWAPWNLEVEPAATIGWHCRLYNVAPIRVGPSAIISQHTYLCTATHDFQHNFQLLVSPIVVEANAWVAAEAFIGPGVIVGEGAIVGARSVVMRTVEPWNIMVGNPAQSVGRRADTAQNALHQDDHSPTLKP